MDDLQPQASPIWYKGAMSISDISLPVGEPGCESQDPGTKVEVPSWSEMTTGISPAIFRVTFDLLEDLKGAPNGGIDIPKAMSRLVQYREKKWVTANEQGQFHWYGGFSNGGSVDLNNKQISIFGLVLKYDEDDGSLVLYNANYEESKKYFPNLSNLLVNKKLAQVKKKLVSGLSKNKKPKDLGSPSPCNVQWSNGFRFDPSDTDGKCLHFTASTKGILYVIFSAVPSDKETWYYVEISPNKIGIYKENTLKVSTVNKNAVGLGHPLLFQSYFVCVTETDTSKGTLIEYGKSMGTTGKADAYLSMTDYHDPLHVRFYSFGNNEEPVQVVDAHVLSRAQTKTVCKGDTIADGDNCVQKCHETCDPIAGCKSSKQGQPQATECNECRYAKSEDGSRCLKECPTGKKPDKKKQCKQSYDLSFKDNEYWPDSAIGGFPSLPEFSICIWFNIQGVKPSKPNEGPRKIFDYVNSADIIRSFPIFYVHSFVNAEETRGYISFMSQNLGGTIRFTKDNKWHHYCITRNCITGETSLFLDGEKKRTDVLSEGLTPSSEGRMRIGGFGPSNFEGKISGLSIWNKVLSEADVHRLSRSCGDSAGSLKDWYDIKGELTMKKYILHEPTACKAAEETPGSG